MSSTVASFAAQSHGQEPATWVACARMPDLRVATLNLFNNRAGRWEERVGLVETQARDLDADVFAFQECDLRGGQVHAVVDALGPDYRLVTLANPAPGSRKSLAIATRLEIADSDGCVDLGASDIALRTRLVVAGRAVEVATTHLHFGPSRRGSETRAAQVRRLVSWLGPVDDRALVLAGDFNSEAHGDTVKAITSQLRSAHRVVHGEEPAWTHPTPLVEIIDTEAAFGGRPLLPGAAGHAIDYVFVSRSFSVRSCTVAFDHPAPEEPRLFPSDHLGLVADLHLP